MLEKKLSTWANIDRLNLFPKRIEGRECVLILDIIAFADGIIYLSGPYIPYIHLLVLK